MSFSLLRFFSLAVLSIAFFLPSAIGSESARAANNKQTTAEHALRLLPVKNIRIEDDFWSPKLRTYQQNTIPHSWQYMENELRALRVAAGETVEGDLNGTWGEANLHKFLETVAYSLALFPDPELEKNVDEIVALLGRAQQEDGYLHAFVTNSKKVPWDPGFLDGSHDGYVLGHMIETAVEYSSVTGKPAFLDIARKAADQAYQHFLGPDGRPGFCGHAELEMALAELYAITGEPRYLELSKAFVEWRGRGHVTPAGETPRAYFQDRVPLRDQMTLEGHAVRAVFFAIGVADLAREFQDPDYRLAANRFWDSTARRRMTLPGGIGPRAEHEAFGEDYELPNNGYYESCASCGLADFAQRMFRLEGRSEYADILEQVLYNAVLHGISLDGTTSYYQNPLSDRDNPRYNSWVCCPPNLSRTLFQIGRYAYACSDRDVFVNLFVGGTCTVPLSSGDVVFTVKTKYPWSGQITIQMEKAPKEPFALHLRLPGWCEKAQLSLNGKDISPLPRSDQGFLRIDRSWQPGEIVELTLDMPVRRIEAHPNIQDGRGKVALARGPVVYAFEGLDNAGTAQIELGSDAEFQTEYRDDFLGGVTVVKGKASNGKPILAVPFYALANRDKSEQEVWVKQQNFQTNSSWWEGKLYRPYRPAK